MKMQIMATRNSIVLPQVFVDNGNAVIQILGLVSAYRITLCAGCLTMSRSCISLLKPTSPVLGGLKNILAGEIVHAA